MTASLNYDLLMHACRDRGDPVAQALASALDAAARGRIQAPSPTLGMAATSFQSLLKRHFPALGTAACAGQCADCRPLRGDEFDDLLRLLLDHRAHPGEEAEWLAHAIASACMGGNHLYQDMGLPHRQALSDLLREHFTALFLKNVGNMKWKKFFYKQLCDQAEVRVCQAPSCQVCHDYDQCFGPEDEAFPASLTGRPATP